MILLIYGGFTVLENPSTEEFLAGREVSKMKEKGEISSNDLESVAGGHFNDPLVQAIMKLDGFKDEWTKIKKGGRWDEDFEKFLCDQLGSEQARNITTKLYKSQRHMFSKHGMNQTYT